ncbi:MAG TPA: hypothetical protein VL485_25455 [Ktedonobacteraceae bacterium]|jgi:hypothetical protein|nr:hypothetical protein [Ktedonobacteraceae bacterium]
MGQTIPDKKTILHLPGYEAEQWCLDMSILLTDLCFSESALIDEQHKLYARSIEGYMYEDGRRAHGSPHIKHISQLLQGDHRITVDLMQFLGNMGPTGCATRFLAEQ